MSNTMPPDWNASTSLHGGSLKDIPEPHVRMFPNHLGMQHRRRVRVRVSQIFQHFHVSLEEEHNPIWNSGQQCWQHAWDDSEGRGRHLMNTEYSLWPDARAWLNSRVAEHFPDNTHILDSDVSLALGDEYEPRGYVREARRNLRQGD